MVTRLLAVGKLKPGLREACDDYVARLRRYGPFEEVQIREAPGSARPEEQRRIEAERLLDRIGDPARVVVLDREGASWSSEQLAAMLDGWRQDGKALALVIGGSTGLDPRILARADQRWSLGPLTLPHQLARLVVLEQWYRAFTILRGEKYHK